MPQLDFGYWPGQIFWLLVTFGVLYLALSSIFLPRIRTTINEREDRIGGDVKEARRLRDLADADARRAEAEMAEARSRAHRTAQEAKARAAAEAARRHAQQESELSARLSKAELRIREARDEAMKSVQTIAEETASALVGKLVGSERTAP